MATVFLYWTDNNLIEDGFKVYRSDTPIDEGSLPPPIVQLEPDTTEFVDNEAPDFTTVYYKVSAILADLEMFSNEVEVTTTGSQSVKLVKSHFDETDREVHDGILLSGDAQSGEDLLII